MAIAADTTVAETTTATTTATAMIAVVRFKKFEILTHCFSTLSS